MEANEMNPRHWMYRKLLNDERVGRVEPTVCVCDMPQLAGDCDSPGHKHLVDECRRCHRPRYNYRTYGEN